MAGAATASVGGEQQPRGVLRRGVATLSVASVRVEQCAVKLSWVLCAGWLNSVPIVLLICALTLTLRYTSIRVEIAQGGADWACGRGRCMLECVTSSAQIQSTYIDSCMHIYSVA